ncbi:hypothetical protein QQF64_018925 [Cirrhinus molitorella]|uniref:Gypsy retrotransposon integrase-like protein 1 n=1 Tax=Cirrhinus molitorella TaxID=172907 RepID=A0ABR3LHE6_9TELE
MSVSVPAPAMFLPCPGEPSMPFDMWLRIFQNYLLVINATGDAWPDTRKRATLLHCLGTEGQRIFYALPETGDTYSSAISALEKHFTPKVNVVVERYAFRKRAQFQHETVAQYVTALRSLATTCGFEDKADDMIRDQLLEHLCCDSIRERLLLESDLTLDTAVTLATQMEAAADQAKKMVSGRGASERGIPVQAVRSKSYKNTNKQFHRPAKPQVTTPRKSCFRCGSDKHLANSSQCPAANVQCKSCNKRGHFARVCRSVPTSKVHEVQLPDVTILYLDDSDKAPKRLFCNATILTPTSAAKEIRLVVDTGSAVSILPNHIYKQHFSLTPLSPPAARLVTYTQTQIPVLGCLNAQVCVEDSCAPATFFVVEDGTALLGMDLISSLHLSFSIDAITTADAMPVTPVLSTAATAPFLAPPTEIGCVKQFVHKVKIDPTVQPIRQKLRRLPFAVRDAVSAEVDRLLHAGIIEEIDASAWVSPIVVTRKKNGGIRMCADLREPNKAVVTDCYPLPHVDELLSTLCGAKIFSTIDLANAYYQVPLHEDSRDITAFITHKGLFRFCRVPYGLASAPSAFQKMMAAILDGVPGVQNYLDDLIIYGATADEHDRTLNTVLLKLKQAGLVLNDEKCHFRQTKLRFLGHVITADGILPDHGHVDAILKAPPPSDATALRSFLGLASWYAKFIPNFAMVVAPMRECVQDKDTFLWSDAAQASFDKVKQLLVCSSALALYDPSLRSVISTDACDYGLGAVFSQIQQDGTEKPVAFASRTLTVTESKYSIVEKEALACVWATEKWRTYLWGTRFTLRTDHQALTTLLTTKGMNRAGLRIARWSARLLCFDYEVVYKPGSQNHTADCLSRLPLHGPADASTDVEPELVALISSTLSSLPVSDFDSACSSCSEMVALREQIDRGWPPSIRAVTQNLMPYYRLRDEFSVQGLYIFRGSRLVVPVSLRHTLVTLAHEGHQGIVRTKQRLRDLYWWPHMDSQVQDCISACIPCQSNDKTAITHPAPLQPVPLPDGPWKKLGLDIVGPFETALPACRYAVTLTDYYSKWPELAFCPSATTDTVLDFLTTTFGRHGNPETVITDNGTQFTSAAFCEFLQTRGIQHSKTSVYYPAANGAAERFHRALKGCIQTAILQSQPWKEAVTNWLQVYRATPHATTSTSPYELLYGRKMRTKLDILPVVHVPNTIVHDTVEKKQAKMKQYTDTKRHARAPSFARGEKVRVRIPRLVPKARPKFSAPLTVEERVGPNTFLLSDGKRWNATHLARSASAPESGGLDCTLTLSMPTSPTSTQPTLNIPPKQSRMRSKPTWHKDYIM